MVHRTVLKVKPVRIPLAPVISFLLPWLLYGSALSSNIASFRAWLLLFTAARAEGKSLWRHAKLDRSWICLRTRFFGCTNLDLWENAAKWAIRYGGYAADMRRIYGGHTADIWQICSGYMVDIRPMVGRYATDIRRTYGGHMADMRWIYGGYTADGRQICGGYTADIRQTCGGYAADMRLTCAC